MEGKGEGRSGRACRKRAKPVKCYSGWLINLGTKTVKKKNRAHFPSPFLHLMISDIRRLVLAQAHRSFYREFQRLVTLLYQPQLIVCDTSIAFSPTPKRGLGSNTARGELGVRQQKGVGKSRLFFFGVQISACSHSSYLLSHCRGRSKVPSWGCIQRCSSHSFQLLWIEYKGTNVFFELRHALAVSR